MISSVKHIVIIGPAHPLRGGLATFNERLAHQFKQEGHNVCIYTFSLQYPSFLFPGTTQYSSEDAPNDIDIKVCINSVNPFNWLKIGNKLKKLKPDIIVVRYWLPFMGACLGTILRRVRKNRHTRVICIADNIIPHEKRIGDKQLTAYFIKPIDAFITMSQSVANDIVSLGIKKPIKTIVHPLYDNFGRLLSQIDAKKYLNIDIDKKVLLFFGFIRKYKGLDILLDAINILKNNNIISNYTLLIAGEFYEDSKPYIEQIQKLGIHDVVDLRPHFIADSEVKYYLCASDVVVQPYRNATQSGVTPLAYHFEIPMIVTNVGGLPSMVPNGKVGLIAEPNAASLAEKIMDYFNKGKEYFLPALIQEKNKYSWENLTNAVFELYGEQ